MLRSPLALLAVTLAVAIVAATHTSQGRCDSRGTPALGIVEVTTGTAGETFYVDDRNFVMGNGIWIYQETNGVWVPQGPGVHRSEVTDHNLQRGQGDCGYTPDDCEICCDTSAGWNFDQILF